MPCMVPFKLLCSADECMRVQRKERISTTLEIAYMHATALRSFRLILYSFALYFVVVWGDNH